MNIQDDSGSAEQNFGGRGRRLANSGLRMQPDFTEPPPGLRVSAERPPNAEKSTNI